MPFKTDKLVFRAARFSSRNLPIKITEKSIKLVKQPDGSFDVPLDKILIKVHAMALNPVDRMEYYSAFPIFSWFAEYGVGHDYSGTVVSIGSKAAQTTTVKVGDKVQGLYVHFLGEGTLSEYILLNNKTIDSEFTTIPKNLSFEEAAGWPLVFGTANEFFKRGKVTSESKILILGAATSVGKYCVQLAKNVHHVKEIVTTNSDTSEKMVRSLGADTTINYKLYPSILNPVLESVKETGQFDLIIDTCGGNDLFPQISEILKPLKEGGKYLTIVGDSKLNYKSTSFFSSFLDKLSMGKRIFLSKLGLSSLHYEMFLVAAGGKWIDFGRDLFESGDLSSFIDSVYEFEDFQQAIDRLESNKAQGKILIKVEKD